jgi:uncharacterized protein with PIN domain
MKFLFDEMLKRLASWCRILGLDSAFYSGKGDTALIALAKKEGRIVVTRDLALSLRCEKAGLRCVFIKSDDIVEQIAWLVKDTGAQGEISFPEKTRCASCNGELEAVGRDAMRAGGKLPENVIEHHERFWRCLSCGKVYWEGGHWRNIMRLYEQAKAKM